MKHTTHHAGRDNAGRPSAADDPPKLRRKRPLPPRHRWPRAKQPQSSRRPCPACGRLDRAVSSRQQITYYGPGHCVCGQQRALRKVERPVDWETLRRLYQIPREL